MKKLLLVAFLGCMLLGFSYPVETNASEDFTKESYYEITKESTISEIEDYLFSYFENNNIEIERNSSEHYEYLFNQLSYNQDENLTKDKNYSEILSYASTYVGNYAEIEMNGSNDLEDKTIDEVILQNKEDIEKAELEGSFSVEPQITRAAGYNPNAAVNYAKKYSIYQNGDYPYYTADCTNFASQVVQAGGMKQSTSKNASGMAWYMKKNPGLSFNKFDYSVPWINAHQFQVYWNAQGKKITGHTNKNSVQSTANVGDALVYQSKTTYQAWHVAIVTKKVNGKIYITQHSVSLNDAKWEDRNLDMSQNVVMVVKF